MQHEPARERALAVRNTALAVAAVFFVGAILMGSPGLGVVIVVALIVAAVAHMR